jgi:hypothetical protein
MRKRIIAQTQKETTSPDQDMSGGNAPASLAQLRLA